MQLIIAVAQDLFTFAVEALFGRAKRSDLRELPKGEVIYVGTSRGSEPMLPPPRSFEMPAASSSPRKNTVMYAATVNVPLRPEPRTDTDAIATLSYGTMLMVLDSVDGWSKVIGGDKEGWVLTDDLADRAAYVYPQFVIGEANFSEDPNTLRLRAMIDDAFRAGAEDLPLQPEEYVLYRLYRRGIKASIPRLPNYEKGQWSTLLRKIGNAAVSPEPKAGAIMQIHFPEDASLEHFSYIEAVFPDDSIQISEVGWPEDGIYNERVLVKEEWHALNPVFFVVS